MKIKKSLLYVGLVIVILSFVGNYFVFTMSQLKKPIMLKHYYNSAVLPGSILELHYIANRSNDIDIQWIIIPGIENEFYSPLYGTSYGQPYKHYQLKTFHIEINEHFSDDMNAGALSFDQVTAHLSNGEKMIMPIGEITLFNQNDMTLERQSSGGSSDNTGFQIFKTDKDIEITGVDLPFANDLKSALTLKVNSNQVELERNVNAPVPEIIQNGKLITSDVFPLALKKDELLSVTHKFLFNQDDLLRFNYYQMDGKLHGNEQNGQKFTDFFSLSYRPSFEVKDLRAIIKEGE
ncbi:hypothetical protein F7731_25290 [Cytobacillus depressus]|uniref:Uncharacterized protein n=1 Tax=Cytobacillus depressus TaxID=1602942 RepID=A0A6L3UZ25_9BACI|nr:hypothetical protein [Cytobacillus depressus]KAB2328540.1 hypothetical protein F7731_25290 [Cytobacillus depressus]